MGLFKIPLISTNYDDAYSPEIGAESRLFVSPYRAQPVGTVTVTGAGAAAFTPDPGYVPPANLAGNSMQMFALQGVSGTADIVLTLNTTIEGAASVPGTAVATIKAPSNMVSGLGYAVPGGLAVDLIAASTATNGVVSVAVSAGGTGYASAPAVVFSGGGGSGASATATVTGGVVTGVAVTTAGSGYTSAPTIAFTGGAGTGATATATTGGANLLHQTQTITGVASITGAAANSVFQIVVLPDLSTFVEIRGVMKKDITPPTRGSISIPERFNATEWVKFGRSEVAKFDATAKHLGFNVGLPQYTGGIVTAIVESWKNDSILMERHVLVDWRPKVISARGDGNAEVEDAATGMYLNELVFC